MSHPKARTDKVAQRPCRGRQVPALEVEIEARGANVVIKINKGAALHTESVLKARSLDPSKALAKAESIVPERQRIDEDDEREVPNRNLAQLPKSVN